MIAIEETNSFMKKTKKIANESYTLKILNWLKRLYSCITFNHQN